MARTCGQSLPQVIFNSWRSDRTHDTSHCALTAKQSAQHGSSVTGEMCSLAWRELASSYCMSTH